MAITEENRHQLYARLEEVLGHEQATTMMEHLPPVGWADVATRRDLDGHASLLRSELDAWGTLLRSELDGVATGLRTELDAVATGLRTELDGVRRDLVALEARIDHRFELVDARFETMEERMGRTLEAALRQQTHRFLAAMGLLLSMSFALDRALGG